MRITHFFAVSMLTILLTACNKEAGVSAESAQSTGFKGEFSRSDSKSESAAKTNKVVAKQQLLTEIVVSAQDARDYIGNNYYVSWDEKDASKYKAGTDFNGRLTDAKTAWENGAGLHFGPGGAPFDGTVFKDQAGVAAFSKAMKLPAQYEDWAKPMDELISRFVKGNAKAGEKFLLRRLAIETFLEGVSPSRGWVTYNDLNQEQSMRIYMNRVMRELNFANLFAAEVARVMPQNFQNPTDLRHDFLEAVIKIPDSAYYAMFKQAADEAGKATNIVVGQGDPSWTSGVFEYDGPPTGWVYRIGGQTVFGQGYINSQLYEVEVASALEVSNKKERTDRESQSFGTDQSDKSSVGVK